MHKNTLLIRGAGIAAALLLAACQPAQDKQDTAPTGIAAEAMGEVAKGLGEASQELQKAQSEIDAARQKLATENLTLNRNENQNLPKAEITPAGDLLIEFDRRRADPEGARLRTEALQKWAAGRAAAFNEKEA